MPLSQPARLRLWLAPMRVEDPLWAATPPAGVLPVTIPGDVTLIRDDTVLACVGSICAYPSGFTFYLLIGLNPAREPVRRVGFHVRTDEERAEAARLQVRYRDGRVADSFAYMTGKVTPGNAILRYSGGSSVIRPDMPEPRAESMWWVSPLPPDGPVEFALTLEGGAGPSGTARIEAATILHAAGHSRALWQEPGRDD
jgi:hypothetical protein